MKLPDELDTLARACRILEMEGHGDLAQGHLSWRDPGGRSFWMKRNDIGLGEVLGPGDFVELDFDGVKLSGSGRSHSEWPIHSEIFLARPDVTVVAHTHPLHSCLMTGSTDVLQPYTLEADKLKPIGRFATSAALVNDREMGSDLAAALGQGDVVFLANHGVAFCGPTIAETVCTGIFLERACHVAVLAASAPLSWVVPSAADRELRNRQMVTPGHVAQTWEYFCRKLDALHTGANGRPLAVYGNR
jgi:ribulose-5-phosphate 4-epimerase/fuculose-1-phosphate aldolase